MTRLTIGDVAILEVELDILSRTKVPSDKLLGSLNDVLGDLRYHIEIGAAENLEKEREDHEETKFILEEEIASNERRKLVINELEVELVEAKKPAPSPVVLPHQSRFDPSI